MFFANRTAIGVALGASLNIAAHGFAAAQASPNAQPSSTRGVRHSLYLAVKSDDPDLQTANGSGGQSDETSKEMPKATLRVSIIVSDHSRETSFFGEAPVTVANFDPAKGSDEQNIWQDARCHHERGFPRMSVNAIDGMIAHGSEKRVVDAKPRRIGLSIPWDEIRMASAFQFGADDRGAFVQTRTRTSESHFSVYLRMYILPCDVE